MRKYKVLIIDDSLLIQQLLGEIIGQDPRLEVVGFAADPYEAREKIKQLNPDVLTLDIEMPRMDGISFLANLMRLRPIPVVMISTLTEQGAPQTLEALTLGAIDFIAKPKHNVSETMNAYADRVREKVHTAATVKLLKLENRYKTSHSKSPPEVLGAKKWRQNAIIAIGASTGGTEAIKEVVIRMPRGCPPIVIAQHIPEAFSASYAQRLDSLSKITVYQAVDGQKLMPGCAYIAPGDDHLQVLGSPGSWRCQLEKSEKVNRHRPSVDVLFDSVAIRCGKNAVSALLTGMGADGAQGMLKLHEAGAVTIAQDEESSVVWGMPQAAVNLGAAQEILPLNKIPAALLAACVDK